VEFAGQSQGVFFLFLVLYNSIILVGVLVMGLGLIGESNAVNEWKMAGQHSWPCHYLYTRFSL